MSSLPSGSVPAPVWRRWAALAYETLALAALAFAATAVWLGLTAQQYVPAGDWGFRLYLLALFKLYFVAGWRYGGQTLGMRPWGLYLVTDRAPLGFGRAMLRYWVALFSWLPAGLGYWWMWLDRDHRAWPDLATGTRVIWRRAGAASR